MVTWFSAEEVVNELQFFVGTAENYLQLSNERLKPKTLFMILFSIETLETKMYDKHNSARLLVDETICAMPLGIKDIGNRCIQLNFFL